MTLLPRRTLLATAALAGVAGPLAGCALPQRRIGTLLVHLVDIPVTGALTALRGPYLDDRDVLAGHLRWWGDPAAAERVLAGRDGLAYALPYDACTSADPRVERRGDRVAARVTDLGRNCYRAQPALAIHWLTWPELPREFELDGARFADRRQVASPQRPVLTAGQPVLELPATPADPGDGPVFPADPAWHDLVDRLGPAGAPPGDFCWVLRHPGCPGTVARLAVRDGVLVAEAVGGDRCTGTAPRLVVWALWWSDLPDSFEVRHGTRTWRFAGRQLVG